MRLWGQKMNTYPLHTPSPSPNTVSSVITYGNAENYYARSTSEKAKLRMLSEAMTSLDVGITQSQMATIVELPPF